MDEHHDHDQIKVAVEAAVAAGYSDAVIPPHDLPVGIYGVHVTFKVSRPKLIAGEIEVKP